MQFYLVFNITKIVSSFQSRSRKLKQSEYDSVIIKPQHFAIFASWIEKKNDSDYNVRNIPYNFDLLYRSSRDGDTAAAFHIKCDNKGSTIVIAKIKNSEQIVGGYNPLDWNPANHSRHVSTKDSFIFSFTNRNNFQTAKISYPNLYHDSYQHSILCSPCCGPIFGCGDLFCSNTGNWTSRPNTYLSNIEIPNRFNVDDYEVFQIENILL